jgi:hypothetical protein
MKRAFVLCMTMVSIGCSSTVNPGFETNDASGTDTASRFDVSVKVDSGVADTNIDPAGEDTSIISTDTGSSADTTVGFDTAPPTDTGVISFDTGKADTKPPPFDGGFVEDKTVGKTCTGDDDCDVTGDGINLCTLGAFGGDSLYPTSVCIGNSCDPGSGTTVMGCDADLGVCIPTSSGGICLPVCSFDDTGAVPVGCAGKNRCNTYAWDNTSGVIGIGYCFGGCKLDTDCPTGNVCQVEDALCVKTKVTYTKLPGAACTDADAKAPAKCNCLYTTAEKMGYCANTCVVGETTCGTGFTCDPSLPRVKLLSTDTVFTKAPKGLAGYCLKNCTADTDCSGLNAYCAEMAGTGQKTCQVGKRPCAVSTDCPTGITCTGATATTLGRCG